MCSSDLMHMDIKPSNFLVQYDSDFEIKPNNISLFDINTLCSVDSEYLRPDSSIILVSPFIFFRG